MEKILGGTALALLLFFQNNLATAEVGVTDAELVIGAHTTESGPLAAAGAVAARGAQAYFDLINSQGGVHGRKIKWIRKDSQSMAPKTVEATKQLVQIEKIFAMVYGQGPSHMAVAQFLSDNGVPDLFYSDGARAYSDTKKFKTNFPQYIPYDVEAKAGLVWAAKNNRGKKFCVLGSKDTLGEDYVFAAKSVIPELSTSLKKKELTLGYVGRVERTASQADTEVLRLKEDKCDVVTVGLNGPLVANAMNYGASQGFKPVWIVENVNVSNKFIELLNPEIREGVVSAANLAREANMTKKENWEKYESLMNKNSIPPVSTAAAGYTGAETFVEVLKRAGKDVTRENLLKAVQSFKGDWQCTLCLSSLKYNKGSNYLFGDPTLIIVKDGKWQILK